ncbi:MAG: hypothetical protein M1834_008684 [Cirrosporium novae-zelandiae]|nr:MAG: hypothetical protein M1834_008684 [Cirrosporium novae-zelandiae]
MSLGAGLSLPRKLVKSIPITAPRDPLLFLYPRWFASIAEAPSNNEGNEHRSRNSNGPSPPSKKYPRNNVQLGGAATTSKPSSPKQYPQDSTAKTLCSFSVSRTSSKATESLKAHAPMIRIQAIFPPIEQRIRIMKTTERIARKTKYKEKRAQGKQFIRLQLRDKGNLSWDWRIPLKILCDAEYPISRLVSSSTYQTQKIRTYKLPRSETWTEKSLADYVSRLTKVPEYRGISRQLYNHTYPRRFEVADTLVQLFYQLDMAEVFSLNALDNALRFCYRHNMVSHAQKLLMKALQQDKVKIGAETFNIVLRACASQSDLHNFTFILNLMVYHQHISPNPRTWISFLMVVTSHDVRVQILEKMRAKGLLVPSIAREASALVVAGDFSNHLNNGGDTKSFLEEYKQQFGTNWFSRSASNQMLNELGKRGLMDQACSLLSYMQSNTDQGTDIVSFNTLLSHCLLRSDIETALTIFDLCIHEFSTSPDGITYNILFLLAWRRNLFNVSRVLWHYACLHGRVSYEIQRKVEKSLLLDTTESPSQREDFLRSAGKVIVGLGLDRANQADLFLPDYPLDNIPKEQEREEIVASASASTPEVHNTSPPQNSVASKEFRKQVTKALVESDMLVLNTHRAIWSQTGLLYRALDMDMEWIRDKLWQRDLRWKCNNSIKIRIARIKNRERDTVLRPKVEDIGYVKMIKDKGWCLYDPLKKRWIKWKGEKRYHQ